MNRDSTPTGGGGAARPRWAEKRQWGSYKVEQRASSQFFLNNSRKSFKTQKERKQKLVTSEILTCYHAWHEASM